MMTMIKLELFLATPPAIITMRRQWEWLDRSMEKALEWTEILCSHSRSVGYRYHIGLFFRLICILPISTPSSYVRYLNNIDLLIDLLLLLLFSLCSRITPRYNDLTEEQIHGK